jgi:hypothetical protein
MVGVWRITSEGDPSSVAPAACCASRTSCRRRRRPSADGIVAMRCCMSYAPRTRLGSRASGTSSSATGVRSTPSSASAPARPRVCATYGPLQRFGRCANRPWARVRRSPTVGSGVCPESPDSTVWWSSSTLAPAKVSNARNWCERYRDALRSDWQLAQLNLHPAGRYDQ